jgi:hypothetical protein
MTTIANTVPAVEPVDNILDGSPDECTRAVAYQIVALSQYGTNPATLGTEISNGHRYLQQGVMAEICEPICDYPDKELVKKATEGDNQIVTAGCATAITQEQLAKYLTRLLLEAVNTGVNPNLLVNEIRAISTPLKRETQTVDGIPITVFNQVCRPICSTLALLPRKRIDDRNRPAMKTALGLCDTFDWIGESVER